MKGLVLAGIFVVGIGAALHVSEDRQPAPNAQTAASEPVFMIGDTARVKIGWPACREKADFDRSIELAIRQKDVVAAARYTSTRACRSFEIGDTGRVEDVAAFSHAACLRRRGEPNCYWMPTSFLDKSP